GDVRLHLSEYKPCRRQRVFRERYVLIGVDARRLALCQHSRRIGSPRRNQICRCSASARLPRPRLGIQGWQLLFSCCVWLSSLNAGSTSNEKELSPRWRERPFATSRTVS